MSSTVKRWLLIGIVIVLAIVATVLTVLALQRSDAAPPEGAVAPVPTFSEQPTASPSPTATEPPVAVSIERSQERFVTVGAGVLWRGVAGACGSVEPLLERSDDDGATWVDVTPRYLAIGQLASTDAFADDQAQIVAAMGDACEVQALRTFTQGQFWAPSDDALAGAAYIDPSDASRVVLGGAAVAAPCAEARGLRASGSVVALTCEGIAYVRADGEAWTPLAAESATAVAIDDGDVVVAHSSAECTGLAVTRFAATDAASTQSVGCAADANPAAATAIGLAADAVLLWSGDAWSTVTQ